MADFLRQLWEPISKLSRGKQIGLGTIILLVFIGVSTASMWSTQKTYIPLFEEKLKLEDASKIITQLKASGISHKLGDSPVDILVPIEDKALVLLNLAENKNLPLAKPGWTQLIDSRTLFSGTTDKEFDLNYIRGLQASLEEALKRMGPIKDATVNIVKPKKELFKDEQAEPTASILLELDPLKTITPENIRAIRDWVCSAVEGLEPENVRIADFEAHDLTRLIEEEDAMTLDKAQTTQMRVTRDREKHLGSKLTKMLSKMFGGQDKVIVSISLDMDFDQKEAVSDVVIPLEGTTKGILISQKTEQEEYKGTDTIKDGEPGLNSNLQPGAPSYPGNEGAGNNEYKRSGNIENYEITKSKEKFIKEQGSIRRLTASVVINDDPDKLKTIEDQITSVAQNAIGYNKDRGDKLTLMVMKFKNESALAAVSAAKNKREQEKKMFMIVVGLFMAIPTFIGIIYIFVRTSRVRAIAREEARLKEVALEAEKHRKIREDEIKRQMQAQWKEWELRYEDIKNFFPEITDFNEKKNRVQNLRLEAYKFAKENDSYPFDFEEMRPEEQFTYRKAFDSKNDGTIDKHIERLEALIQERNKAREEELKDLNREANAREQLEARIRDLVVTKQEDAVQVMRLWLGKS